MNRDIQKSWWEKSTKGQGKNKKQVNKFKTEQWKQTGENKRSKIFPLYLDKQEAGTVD